MTTKLARKSTVFWPFNQGNDGAAGNPANPNGHRTAYFWEAIWARPSWLEILGRYVIAQRDKKKQIERIIFPRFHQLDVTRKLQAAVLADGPGGKYRVKHRFLGRQGMKVFKRVHWAGYVTGPICS